MASASELDACGAKNVPTCFSTSPPFAYTYGGSDAQPQRSSLTGHFIGAKGSYLLRHA